MRYAIYASIVIGLLSTDSTLAGTIVGGSELLTPGHVNQVETWLGQGPLQLTNIYTKQPGDDGPAFHLAVDGKGPTFAILEVLGATPQLVGGFNPVSWDGLLNDWFYTLDDADRTSFIFNLTTSVKQDQRLGQDSGKYQAYNVLSYGPTFGGGADIAVFYPGLESAYFYNYSFGPLGSNTNILGHNGLSLPTIGRIEVFTIAPDLSAPTVEAPEPLSSAVWCIVAACAATIYRRLNKLREQSA